MKSQTDQAGAQRRLGRSRGGPGEVPGSPGRLPRDPGGAPGEVPGGLRLGALGELTAQKVKKTHPGAFVGEVLEGKNLCFP